MGDPRPPSGDVPGGADRPQRPDLRQIAAERVVGERQRLRRRCRRGHAAEQVVRVGHVRLGARQVLGRHPIQRIERERDRLVGAVAEAGDVAVRVVAELLVVGAVAGAGALGR